MKASGVGPARVLIPKQRILKGPSRPTSAVWGSHGDDFPGCAPDQLRPAQEAGRMVPELGSMEKRGATRSDLTEAATSMASGSSSSTGPN